jgi:hypothetical protein
MSFPQLLLVLSLLLSIEARDADAQIPAFAKKYPGGLLTGDYGIVTEQDLELEASTGTPGPFKPSEDSPGYNRWQCFPVKDVKPKVRTWRDSDGAGPNNVIVTMCDLETWVEHHGQIDVYYGRRAKENTYCREYLRAWKHLTRGEPFVCLSGEYHGISPPEPGAPQIPSRDWTWDKIKTKKGCHSYFTSECDVAYGKGHKPPRPSVSVAPAARKVSR